MNVYKKYTQQQRHEKGFWQNMLKVGEKFWSLWYSGKSYRSHTSQIKSSWTGEPSDWFIGVKSESALTRQTQVPFHLDPFWRSSEPFLWETARAGKCYIFLYSFVNFLLGGLTWRVGLQTTWVFDTICRSWFLAFGLNSTNWMCSVSLIREVSHDPTVTGAKWSLDVWATR